MRETLTMANERLVQMQNELDEEALAAEVSSKMPLLSLRPPNHSNSDAAGERPGFEGSSLKDRNTK
jgi:hypothetical protein